MMLLQYEGSAKVVSASGLIGGYAVGGEAKGKIELKGDDVVIQTMKGTAEARCKLDSVTKFEWLLKPANYEWTEWFPVQLNGSTVVMVVENANGSGNLTIDVSPDMQTMLITGSVSVKNVMAKILVSEAEIVGTAEQSGSGQVSIVR